MLERGSREADDFLEQLDRARVVGQCPSGCASIDFETLPNLSALRPIKDCI